MRQNIGLVNAMIRIAGGLTVLAVYSAKFSRKPQKESYILMMMLGAMKVAEGVVRFCPVTELFHVTKEINEMKIDDIADSDIVNPS
ncbi:DUF2892 domain-containing protein [Fictibacillus iocasae]|uniref:DUF2892 domain-containing protein n=1 Tax=Fictibacillus iocasae TaxID=2715437 RepID=A0ABW2NRW5_9BACL